MRVQCHLCEHENGGFCYKKQRGGKPIKVKTKKRRICASYTEEAVRVLADYRKREKHRAALRNQELRRARMKQAIKDAQAKALRGRAVVKDPEGQ